LFFKRMQLLGTPTQFLVTSVQLFREIGSLLLFRAKFLGAFAEPIFKHALLPGKLTQRLIPCLQFSGTDAQLFC
jgi:hypothetical protein